MYCRKCGKELAAGSKFCSYCGSPADTDSKHENYEPPKSTAPRKNTFLPIVAILTLVALIIVIVCMCAGKRTASKDDICKEIQEYGHFDQFELNIKEYTEVKRDTNKNNKYDKIWVDILAENDSIAYTASYIITYGLYNDGWLLENIEILDDDFYALENLELAQVSEDLQNAHKSVINTYALTNISVEADIPLLDTSNKILSLTCVATAENEEMAIEATIEAHYQLKMSVNGCGWVLTGSNMEDYSYAAKHGPSEALIEETTRNWSGEYEWVSEYLSYSNNEFIIEYEEHDETGFKDCVVDWENTLTYKFNPNEGGWYLYDEQYKVTDASLDLIGLWGYSSGEEYVNVNAKAADSSHIEYDLEYSFWPDNPFHVGIGYLTDSGTDLTRDWTYEYDEDELCLIFTTTEPIFAFSYVGGSYTDEYTLYYKAYLAEIMGTSGFYVDGNLLTLSN